MRNNIKSFVIVSVSVIGLLFAQSCKKETTNQPPVIQLADELQPEAGQTYVVIESGMALHLEFTAKDDRGLASGTVRLSTNNGQSLYDTTIAFSGQTSYLFHQHYHPESVTDTTYATVAISITDTDNVSATDTAFIQFLP